MTSEQLLLNHQSVISNIQAVSEQYGRPAPQLLAVSKTKPAHMVETLYGVGQRDFGENYLQDALPKIASLAHLDGIQWHFIGQIQSNKTKDIATHFSWAHGVDRLKIAKRLSDQRPADLPPLNICIQVDLDGSVNVSKGGVLPDDVLELAIAIQELKGICLRGLMCIPEPRDTFEKQKEVFERLSSLQEDLNKSFGAPTPCSTLDTLSMGMSNDVNAAIAAGSTMVRIGSHIFGTRN